MTIGSADNVRLPELSGRIGSLLTELASLRREAGSVDEGRAAHAIRDHLRALDMGAVTVDTVPAHGNYWKPLGLLTTLALGSTVTARVFGVPLALAALLGVVDELDGGQRLRRRLLARGTTQNVSLRIGGGAPRHVVVVAHYDAARSGRMFNPRVLAPVSRLSMRLTRNTPPLMAPLLAGPLLALAGACIRRRCIRAVAGGFCAGTVLTLADVARSPVVDGANDNLSGVAVLLGLAERLKEQPLKRGGITLVATGAEESGLEGMRGLIESLATSSNSDVTVICVDSVGSERLVCLDAEGPFRLREHSARLRALARRLAHEAEIPLHPGVGFRGATDAAVAQRAGFETLVLASVSADGMPADYHWPTDKLDRVNGSSVASATRLCEALVRDLVDGTSGGKR